jgi:endonuclease YncB( thermonuclease family)
MRKPAEFAGHWMPFPTQPEYRAVVKHVVDGDTMDVYCDLGMYDYAYVTVRLQGIDTPEINSGSDEDKERGKAARDRVRELVQDKPVRLVTYKDKQTFARFVADVFYMAEDGIPRSLAATLIKEGHIK